MVLRGTGRAAVAPGALVAVLLGTLGCSSPTAATPPSPPPPTPPPPAPTLVLECPPDQTGTSTASAGMSMTFPAPVASGGVAPAQTSCTPASASVFPIGVTTVRCTATDAVQATSSCTFNVTVAPPLPMLSRLTFLAFGDSMTAGELYFPAAAAARDGIPNLRFVVVPSTSYPTRLLDLLRGRYTTQSAQVRVTNAGLSGEWAEDGAKRLPTAIRNAQPEVVLLLEGTNDVYALGSSGIQRAWRAIDTMAKEVRNRGARLFLATLPPPGSNRTTVVPLAHIQELNSLIRATARGENAVVVDVYGALSTDVARYIGPDGLHPTEAGYLKIAETFFTAIRVELERAP